MTRLALILAHEAIRHASRQALRVVADLARITPESRVELRLGQWYVHGDLVVVWPRGHHGEWPLERLIDSIERGEVFTVMVYEDYDSGEWRVVVTLTRDEIVAPDEEREEDTCDE